MNILLLTKTSAVSIEDLATMASAIALSGNVFAAAWQLRPLSVGALASPAPWQLKVVQRIIAIVGGEAKTPDEFGMNGCSSLFDGPAALSVMLDAEIKESLASAAPVGWIARRPEGGAPLTPLAPVAPFALFAPSTLLGVRAVRAVQTVQTVREGVAPAALEGAAPAALEDAFEAVGPVLGTSYSMKIRLRGVMRPVSLSNFLLPKWYGQESPASIGFDHLGICKDRYEILPSGYHLTREVRQDGAEGGMLAVKKEFGRACQESVSVRRHIEVKAKKP